MGEPARRTTAPSVIRFGLFQADLRSSELLRNGRKIKLEGQPFQVLALLLERPGELVTRDELQKTLWPGDTFVDFEQSINAAVRRLRDALGESAESPRFIETLPRRGYRFIGAIDPIRTAEAPSEAPPPGAPTVERRRTPGWRIALAAVALVSVLVPALVVTNTGGLRDRMFGPSVISLAVLPVRHASPDAEHDRQCDGLTDVLIEELRGVDSERLRVSAFSTVQAFKNSDLPPRDIARRLNVQVLLQSSLVVERDRRELTVELVRPGWWTRGSIWSHTYLPGIDGSMSRLASDVAAQLFQELTPGQQPPLAAAPVIDPRAWEATLNGRSYYREGSKQSYYAAEQKFLEAIHFDPTFDKPYGYLALVLSHGGIVRAGGLKETRPQSRAWAMKALEVNRSSAEAHTALAWAAMTDWDWQGTEEHFQKAIDANPNLALTHTWYSQYLSAIHRTADALAEADIALRLEPDEPITVLHASIAYYVAGDHARAIGYWRALVDKLPGYWPARNHLARAALKQGRPDEAIRQLDEALRRQPYLARDALYLALQAHAHARAGDRHGAQAIIDDLLRRKKAGEKVGDYWIAIACASVGDGDQTLMWLENAFEKKGEGIVFMDNEELLDSVRATPRFREMIRNMALPPGPAPSGGGTR